MDALAFAHSTLPRMDHLSAYAKCMFDWDWTGWTTAALGADVGMQVPKGLMSFANDGRGAPTKEQRSLYLAAVAFTYAVWENYIEDLAIELVGVLSKRLPAERVPGDVKDLISKNASPWELSVHPGWQGLWRSRVSESAKGTASAGQWGINTADATNVSRLFKSVGVDALPKTLAAPIDDNNKVMLTPPNIHLSSHGSLDVTNALSQLIGVRGEAVHTAKTSDKLLKREVLWWSAFVHDLYEKMDEQARRGCAELLKT
jgi:hypothetical protein